MFSLYNQSLALLVDLYEITMAYAYWKSKMAEDEAVFHLFFRKKPFQGGFTVTAGLESVIDYIKNWHFDDSDLHYLSTLHPFEEEFLTYLSRIRFSCDVDAMREGEVVFPYEPLVRVTGPILQAQLLETPLLTLINFPTLIATKAARVCLAAGEDPVLEFGLRRAQGIDGAMTATRATYIGGCESTSNTLAGKLLGIPVRGTHAHSWVMAFENELESFEAYANALPDNCVFLVDTYDSILGIKHAIIVAKRLREMGRPFLGVRLDSGDIAYLSIQGRKMLDEAGFHEAKIFASNELSETLILDLKRQGAKVAVWGVGTHLVTGQTQSALDGVYKLSAYRKKGENAWSYKLKLSERMSKISDPGILQVRRFAGENGNYIADALYDINTDLSKGCRIVDPLDSTRSRLLSANMQARDLLVPVFRRGEPVYQSPSLETMKDFAKKELRCFDATIKRFYNPHSYPIGMEESLYQLKLKLIDQLRNKIQHESSHHH
ncbi:MAG: nicotinate phosphoribosyltransferase [Chlamydiales bacterium]